MIEILGFLKGIQLPTQFKLARCVSVPKKKKKDFPRVFLTPEAADQHFPFLTQGSQECLLQSGKEAGNILRKDFGGGVQSLSLMSNSLQPHGLQHARLLCPSLSPRVSSNSCPLSQCCYLTISSSATPFSFYLQS